MKLGDTIRSGVQWVMVGRFGLSLLGFGISIVLARLLHPSDFGLLVTVQIFTGLAGFVAGGGMGQALIRSKTFEMRDSHIVFTAQLVICTSLYLVFFSISPWFARWFDEPLYEILMRVSAISFLIRPFMNVPNSLLHREMRFKARALIGGVNLLVTGTTSITMALNGFGVWSLVVAGITGSLVGVVLTCSTTGWQPRIAFDKAVLTRLGGYGIKVSLNDIVVYFQGQSSNFVISRFLGTEAVGLYNKAASLNARPRAMISGSAYAVVFRALSKTQDNLDQSKYIYLRTLTLVTVYALPVYLGFWWLAEPFIVTIYGPNWAGSAPILQILALSGLFQLINNISGAVSAARNMLGRELIIQLIGWALMILGIVIGFQWGIEGVAWGVVAASFPLMVMMAVLASRELKVTTREIFVAIRPALILNAIMFAALWAGDTLLFSSVRDQRAIYLLSMSGLGAAVYAGCFLYLPIPQLKKEANRWKHRFRLPHVPDDN